MIFRFGTCLVKSNSITEPQLIGKRQAESRTCTLLGIMLEKAQTHSASTTNPTKSEDVNIWHRRFAHLNLAYLRFLLPRELYTEKETTRSACSICAPAKAKQLFQRKISSTQVAEKPLALIHSDLCGPISPMSQSGCRYYILYIDDYSRQSWVFFLCSKTSAEICAVFREFKTMTELKFST